VEAIEQLLDAPRRGPDRASCGDAVAGEELADAERSLQCGDPNHDVAHARAINSSRRRMKARIEEGAQLTVGLDERQQVVATDLDNLAVHSCRDLGEPRRPDNMVASPVNIPGLKDITTSRWPTGDDVDPGPPGTNEDPRYTLPRLDSTSPCATWRAGRPCGAMRASCAGVSVG